MQIDFYSHKLLGFETKEGYQSQRGQFSPLRMHNHVNFVYPRVEQIAQQLLRL
jgi:hypothetical protein